MASPRSLKIVQLQPAQEARDGLTRLRQGLPELVQQHPDLHSFLDEFRRMAREILAGAESPEHRIVLLAEIVEMALEFNAPVRQLRALLDDEPAR